MWSLDKAFFIGFTTCFRILSKGCLALRVDYTIVEFSLFYIGKQPSVVQKNGAAPYKGVAPDTAF